MLTAALALVLAGNLSEAMPASGERLLAQFDAHCGTRDTIDAVSDRIAKAGAMPYDPPKGSTAERLVGWLRTNGYDGADRLRIFADRDRPQLLTLVTFAPQTMVLECHILHEAAVLPDLAVATSWAGSAPLTSEVAGAIIWRWSPSLKGQYETVIAYSPRDSDASHDLGTGLRVYGRREIG